MGRPFLPAGRGPVPPCPGLPVTACLFVSPGGGGGSDGGGRRREIVLIMPWFPAGNGRQTRSPPPSLAQEAGNARTDMPGARGRPRPAAAERARAAGVGILTDVRVVPHQHPHSHLDARRVFQAENFSQTGHHGVQPRGLGLLQLRDPGSQPRPQSTLPFRNHPLPRPRGFLNGKPGIGRL